MIARSCDPATDALSVSVITPTIGRPTLQRAVESALSQRGAAESIEVIVVNDSGRPLPYACWMAEPDVRIIDTDRCERSAARNAGAAAARGDYLLFLDDDDYLLPGAACALLDAARAASCPRACGGYRLVDESGEHIADVIPEVHGDMLALFLAGESIPLGASLITRELFFAAGAFNPGYTALEDYDLVVRSTLLAPIVATRQIVACFRVGARGGSTDWTNLPANLRRMREVHLDTPGLVSRALVSAGRDGQLRGRLVRVYLASVRWNVLQARKSATANFSVVLQRLAGAARLSGSAIITRAFWRGLWRRGVR